MATTNASSTVAAPATDTSKCYDPLTPAPDAAKRDPIEYIVQFNAPETHYVDVAAHFPTEGKAAIELMLPVWTPGSYMVREYARNIEGAGATTADGASLPMAKTAKNRWQVTTNGAKVVLVRYRVYGHELTVRNNWIERDYALLNGAATFMTLADGQARPHDVRVVPHKGWKTTATGMPPHPDGSSLRFRAPSFDVLVDSPILTGANLVVHEFEESGKKHTIVTQGGGNVWDNARFVADVQKIVATEHAFWNIIPYKSFTFLNMLNHENGGGLEHGSSTVLMGNRWASRDREDYTSWLSVVAHEFFHTWNIKRLRPVALGPFDYERENHTPSLWVVEGVTSYYDDMFVHRAGLTTRDEYLKFMSKNIERLQNGPGRKAQSLDASSFDAWIKFYRPDENSNNSGVSYYTKGAIVAWLLDLEIRKATNGAKSMDDVMRAAYAKYAGTCGYTEEQFRALISETAGTDMSTWLAKAVSSTQELDYDSVLAWVGLRFKTPTPPKKGEGAAAGDPWMGTDLGWLGADFKNDNGRNVVKSVLRDGPAHQGGLNADDELLGIDQFRVRAGDLENRLKRYHAGDNVELLVARRDELLRIPVKLGVKPNASWELEVIPDADATVVARRDAWLAGKTTP